VDGLLEKDITPFATLYHWDLPQTLEDRGGWSDRNIVNFFGEYTDLISRSLGDRVKNWMTLNEPNAFCFSGYYTGRHAPGKKENTVKNALQVTHHALLAHGHSVDVLRSNLTDCHVGIALSLGQAYPVTNTEKDIKAAQLCDGYHNRWFADPIFGKGYPADMLEWYGDLAPEIRKGDMAKIAVPIDFLGINAYCPDYVRSDSESPFGFYALTGHKDELTKIGIPSNELGWPIAPESLEDLLVRVNREYNPKSIIIAENGNGSLDSVQEKDIDDRERTDYLKQHISAVLNSKNNGVPVDGYFVWSLMDNFEWALGYSMRFGIVYIDYLNNNIRIPKSSFYYYKDFIRSQK
jgi:beta-glucosidase